MAASRGPAPDPERFLPLKPRILLMLLALAQGQRHGYALKEEVRRRTNGRLDLGPGTLYRTIRELERDGLIVETEDRPEPEDDDERRRYYRLTDLGREVAALESTRLAEVVQVARARDLIP